jgi:hypothetical protein
VTSSPPQALQCSSVAVVPFLAITHSRQPSLNFEGSVNPSPPCAISALRPAYSCQRPRTNGSSSGSGSSDSDSRSRHSPQTHRLRLSAADLLQAHPGHPAACWAAILLLRLHSRSYRRHYRVVVVGCRALMDQLLMTHPRRSRHVAAARRQSAGCHYRRLVGSCAWG